MARKTASREPRLRLNLEKLRNKRGVSLESISETTKISRRFLQAIENEDFGQLPGGVFNTSYLRQYAAAVGLEEGVLLNWYLACTRPATGDSAPRPKRPSWIRWFRTPDGLSGSGA